MNIGYIESALLADGMEPALVYGSPEPESAHNMGTIEAPEDVVEDEPPSTCEDCGEVSENAICDDCEENYTCCDACNDSVLRDDTVTTNDDVSVYHNGNYLHCRTFCDRCTGRYTEQCDDCGETVSRDEINHVRGYGSVCQDCIDYNYSHCDDCDETSHNDDPCDCNKKSRLIHYYSYKPKPVFFGTPGKMEGYLGVELEVNTEEREEHAQELLDQMGDDHVYLKEEGSIGEGFEIVTHPHTMAEQTKLWANFKAPDGMTSAKSGLCGLHVHYSRKGLTQLHINRMVVFMNAPENTDFMEFIAQRSCLTRWATVKPKTITSKSSDRYESLNLCNCSTIEFRMFKGNTRVERIMKCLEFVVATVAWSSDRSYRDLGYKKFIDYVSKNGKQYPNLKKFISEGWKG
jgi:hypothetical protein